MSFHFNMLKKKGRNNVTVKNNNLLEREYKHGDCASCPLNYLEKSLITPKMLPAGPDDASIYVLGEAPGEQEDIDGEAFVGDSGMLLQKAFTYDVWDNEVRRWNTIRCRPQDNRNPVAKEISSCRGYIEDDIAKVQPVVVVGTGNIPLSWSIGQNKIGLWRGRKIPIKVKDHVCWYMPIHHPSYILRNGGMEKSQYANLFLLDVEKAIEIAKAEVLPTWIDSDRILSDSDIIINSGLHRDPLKAIEDLWIEFCKRPSLGCDIEGYPLRPYSKDSIMISIALSYGRKSFAYSIEHETVSQELSKKLLEMTLYYLLRSGKKICHNLAFEMEWFASKLSKHMLRRTEWADTMAQSYLLGGPGPGKKDDDPRGREMLSLDQAVLETFGFPLKAISNLDRKDMRKHKIEDVLVYNNLDSKWTFYTYHKRKRLVEQTELRHEYHRLIRSTPTVVLSQLKGMKRNEQKIARFSTDLTLKISNLDKDIRSTPEVKKFEISKGSSFNPASADLVGEVLHKYFKEPSVIAPSGKYATPEPVLKDIDNDFSKLILQRRGLAVLLSTFILPLVQGSDKSVVHDDLLIHTVYNLMITRSGRLSSDSPNLQNYPKRKNIEIRECLEALFPWLRFLSIDYAGMEARVIAMASEDRTLVEALWNRYDIHLDWAEKGIYLFGDKWVDLWWKAFGRPDDAKLKKELRQLMKNQWVFPQFFGASATSCSRNLQCKEDRAYKLADDFWLDFKGVKNWHKRTLKFYDDHGYVENLMGSRRRYGPIGYNELINTPIQGSASDIVVDAMNRLSEKADATGETEFQAVLNVHDDLTFAVHKDRIDERREEIVSHMLYVPFKFADIVPIEVEAAVGDSWGNMKEVGSYSSIGRKIQNGLALEVST